LLTKVSATDLLSSLMSVLRLWAISSIQKKRPHRFRDTDAVVRNVTRYQVTSVKL